MKIWEYIVDHSNNPFAVDLRSLALARVCFALILLYDCLITLPSDVRTFFSDEGILDRNTALFFHLTRNTYSLNMLSGEIWFQYLLLALQVLFALMLLFGYKTRTATILSWLLLSSQYARNFLLLSNAELLSRTLLLWSIFIPWGHRWSVDAALASSTTRQISNDKNPLTLPQWFFSVGTMLFLAQGYIMYFMTAALKNGRAWKEGEAVMMVLGYESMILPAGKVLREILSELPLLNNFLTYSTLVIEFVVPVALVIPLFNWRTRIVAIILMTSLHLGISLTILVGLFTPFCLTFWIATLPPSFWNFLASKADQEKISRTTIFYDGKCGFCKKMVYILRGFLCVEDARILPAESDEKAASTMELKNSWVIRDSEGTDNIKFSAFLVLLSISPLAKLLYRPFSTQFVRKIGDYIYRLTSNNRKLLSTVTRPIQARMLPVTFYSGKWTNFLLLPFFFILIDMNIRTHSYFFVYKDIYPTVLYKADKFAQTMLYRQKWNMFSPKPATGTYWISLKTELENGRIIDLMRDGSEYSEEKPKLISAMYPSSRWFKLFEKLRNKYSKGAKSTLLYFCREQNRDAALGEKAVNIEMISNNTSHTARNKVKQVSIIKIDCDPDIKKNYMNQRQSVKKYL